MKTGHARMGGIAACLLGLGLTVLQAAAAAASCPDWTPPKVPTVEEARTSDLCKGTPYEARVETLKRASPEADANAQAARGSFRLMRFLPHGECGPWYPLAQETACKLTPETTPVEHQASYLKVFVALYENQTADVHCATVYGALIEDYVRRFNRTLVAHTRFPNRDLCRYTPFKGDWNAFWKDQETGPKLHDRPKAEDVPATFESLPAAARFGDVEAVKRFLARGAKPDALDDWHVTALEWSAIRGYNEVFKLLVNLPAGQSQDFCAALEDAIHFGRAAMADTLIPPCAKQPGPRAANDRNRLTNHVAGRGDLTLLKRLVAVGFRIDAGPPKDFRDSDIEPAHYRPLSPSDAGLPTASHPLDAAAAMGHTEVAEFLLTQGADINGVSTDPWRLRLAPIHSAISGKQPAMVDWLLRHGAKLDPAVKLPEHISSPIHFAIDHGNADILRVLVQHGADLDQFASDGTPAIFMALSRYRANKDALETLLRLGANPNLQSKPPDGRSAAARLPQKYWFAGVGRTPIMQVIARGPVRCESPIMMGPPPEAVPRLPTHCQHEGLPILELLLAHGAKLDMTDSDGLTALHHAARIDYGLEIAKLLLFKGADVNARDDVGRTPLDHAMELGLERMPPLLIRHGGKSGRDLR